MAEGKIGTAKSQPKADATAADRLASRDPDASGALARGFAILRAFEEGAIHLGNKDISRRTGIPKATVSRLTSTLNRLGYLSFSQDLQKYSVSPGILALAYQVFMTHELHLIARPWMQRLAEETRSTVGLAVQDGTSVVYLEYAKTRFSQASYIAVGYRVPIARTALGRSCLSAMQPDARAALLRDIRKDFKRNEWPDIEQRITAGIESVWKRGFCMADGEIIPSNRAVGIPFIHNGKIYAFNCVGPVFEFTPTRMLEEIGPALIKLTQDLRSADVPLPNLAG